VPMLERVARRLIDAGVERLIVNTHHFEEQIVDFVASRGGFGVEVVFSPEPVEPLETGGGLKHAAHLFRGDGPFFLHNADILTDLPLKALHAAHVEAGPLATLAVMERPSARCLLFDDGGLLGRADESKDLRLECRAPSGDVKSLAFAGIHVVSPAIFQLLEEDGVFSILQPYLRLASGGHRILPFRMDGWGWVDIGKPEQLAEANRRTG
jgi:N-acetyl-alpha-D-muramate 1-phosphate uridylyltransferase